MYKSFTGYREGKNSFVLKFTIGLIIIVKEW